jgi:predicted amidohydrolase
VIVSVGQIATTLDKSHNLDRVHWALEQAARDEAELLVLPEGTMTSFGENSTELVPFAEDLDGPFVNELAQAASSSGITVVAGMFEPSPEPGRVYNTIVAVGPAGLIGSYRKVHLYDALGWCESDQITRGDSAPEELLVFSIGEFTAGVMNCYDLRFPELARVLVDRGATLLLEPAHWLAGPGKDEVWRTLLRARAIENTAYVAAAAKPAPGCTGYSSIVDPRGVVVAELDGSGEGLLSADISAHEVSEVRAVLPVLENRRYRVTAV